MFTSDMTPGWLNRGLNLLGVTIVGFSFAWNFAAVVPPWLTALAFLALAAWLVTILLPRRTGWIATALSLVMVVAGAIATVGANGLLIVPVVVGIMLTMTAMSRPLWHGLGMGLVAVLIIAVAAVLTPVGPLALLSLEGGIALAVLVGINRRQSRAAEDQSRRLLEERVAIREEQARAAVLEQRQAVARDIHDVLAHSLGGLVIQLDAVEALLEAGRRADAEAHVREARQLAASGLADARRAVDALRDPRPAATVRGEELARSLEDLARSHRSLGGEIDFPSTGVPNSVGSDEARALHRAFQEALTNARTHAPGAPVMATVRWGDRYVVLDVRNPIATPAVRACSGGGHGLVGMVERFDRLPAASVSVGERDGVFVVTARIGQE